MPDAGDACEGMFAFGGMLRDTEIPEVPVNIEEEEMLRFLTVLCVGNVSVLAGFCCWEFIQLSSTWTTSVPIGCLATVEREICKLGFM